METKIKQNDTGSNCVEIKQNEELEKQPENVVETKWKKLRGRRVKSVLP